MKMKKFLVIGLAVALAACMVGCKNNEDVVNPDVNNSGDNQTVVTPATNDVSGDIITLMTNANVMVNAPYQDYIPAEMAESYVGLTQEEYEANIEEGVFYESMMSPANQSYCLLKVKEGADVAALQQKVFDNANPRKWICMTADRVLVMADDSYIMLAMGTQEACDALKTEFATLAGSDVKEALDRTVNDGEALPEDLDLPGMGDQEAPIMDVNETPEEEVPAV
jgi:hypothetical protein